MNRSLFSAFLAGLIFGIGLLLSGMANPEKVLAFLDLFGAWDPSLGLVMAGAICIGMPAFYLAGKRGKSLFGGELKLPSRQNIDRRLVLGGLVFGIGWGLAGFCPGPGIVATGAGEFKALVFAAAMVAGMGIFQLIESRRAKADG